MKRQILQPYAVPCGTDFFYDASTTPQLGFANSCRHAEVKDTSKLDFYQQQELQALLDVSGVFLSRALFDLQTPPKPLAMYLQAGKTKREWLADSLFYASDTSAASTVYIADSLLSVLPTFTTTRYQDRSCYYDLKNAISTAPDSKQFDGTLHVQSCIIHPILVEKLTLKGRNFIHKDKQTIRATIQGNNQVVLVSRVVFNSEFSKDK